MSNDIEDLTIRDMFTLRSDGPPEVAAGLRSENFRELEKKIASSAKPIEWHRVQDEIATVISGTLNTTLLQAWTCAWKKYADLKRDIEESRKSPEASVISHLVDHAVESALQPYVEVFLGSHMIQKIVFNVTLTTQLEGLLLGLKGGCLSSLQLARCEWTGSIACGEITLVERPLAELDLPGRMTLKHPIPLSPAGA